MFTYCNFLSGRAEMIQVRKVCDESDDGWEGRGRPEGGEGCRGGGGEREIIHLSLHCHHRNALRWAAMRAI